jgi:hypothetical protein
VSSEEGRSSNDEESSHNSAEAEKAVVKEAPRKGVRQKPTSLPPRSGGGQRRKSTKEEMAEIKDVMKDRSLSRTERLEKVQQIKARYAAAEEEGDVARMEEEQVAAADATVEPQVTKDVQEQGSGIEIDREQSKEEMAEIKLVMKDKSLSKKDKTAKIKKIKAKYDAENKKISKVKSESAAEEDPDQPDSDKEMGREVSKKEKAEIKLVMKDKDLAKKDKKKKIKMIKAKYDAASKERMALVKTVEAAAEDDDSDNDADEGQDDSDKEMEREPSKEERAEIKKITKDKKLSKTEKAKMIKRIKAKYDKKNTATKGTDAKKDAVRKETMAFQYSPQKSRRKEGSQERSTSPVPKEGERQDSIKANDKSKKSISSLPSNDTSSSNLLKDVMAPLESEELQTDRTPIKKLVKMLEKNDPLLNVLKLDGRKKIKPEDWESFFQSLESNNALTHLSISRCDLSDEIVVNLVLALVDNETLIALKLSSNKGLTDDTGKGFIKVLTQSNKTLKKLDLSKTKVSKKALDKISGIMEKRDDQKKIARMQDLRQSKILDLLSFSAGDNIATERRMSELLAESDDEINDASTHSGKSGRSGRRQSVRSAPGGVAGRGGLRGSQSGGLGASQVGGRGRGGAALRSSITARNMAQLGGDSLGADSKKLREQRKMKGECEDCGQRCFLKSMFKATPLTIPNVVYEGRCLKCNPM